MPVDLMLVAASVVIMFVVFAAVLAVGRFADPSRSNWRNSPAHKRRPF